VLGLSDKITASMIVIAFLVATLVGASEVAAQDACRGSATGGGLFRTVESRVNPWDARAVVGSTCEQGITVDINATRNSPPEATNGRTGGMDPTGRSVGQYSGPAYCRRDDHAFLPPQASAGIPCDAHTPGTTEDPRDFARSMFDHMDLPSLRLNMNPLRGMVAVPTWFWIEGYDGGVIGLVDNLQVSREECHREADRDEGGAARLDAGGSPVTHNECHTIIDTFTVEVRAWPKVFQWNFGDDQGKTVPCADTAAACPNGAGRPFTDPYTPSPIAHAYRWSSLGANGDADAYSIGLGITFGAQYRFSVNGGSRTGWEGLDDRDLSWSTRHQVQEAQAVLTRP
jgi:hypothetical protein